jgi:hypothetical protein
MRKEEGKDRRENTKIGCKMIIEGIEEGRAKCE